tara:strand:+ start:2145 stop:2588 length:444 start_codon:yes stop_codon:yes gene_type:complete
MNPKLKIVFGVLLIAGLSSFIRSESKPIPERKRFYTNELQNGDSLVIISSFSGCFSESGFTLEIFMESDQFHLSYQEGGKSEIISKTLPLSFKKELSDFELRTVPNMAYGIGTSCKMIFKFNNERFDTIRECPQEKYYYRLLERIKN